MRESVKTAFLLALFGYLMFLFGVEVGEFSERWNRAQRLAAGVVGAVRVRPASDEPAPPVSDGE
jgi:hypothetical protein